MSYEVEIIADSRGPNGARLSTFQLKYPRMIHQELLTHRLFSRNASSSRAIPVAKMIEWVEKDPAMPVFWGSNRKGMQATEELDPQLHGLAEEAWLLARDHAVAKARRLEAIGVHKQITSRILEPWAHINVVVSTTSFDNFFSLRCHKDAMPEMQVLAVRMARAYRDSEPTSRRMGDWHLPYVTDEDRGRFETGTLLKLSVARCARVSYRTFEGKEPDPESDIRLHDHLASNGHFSPFEHQGRAQFRDDMGPSGNFVGWTQYRSTLPVNVHESFDFSRLDQFDDRDFIV